MNKITLKSLKFKAFRSFVDVQEINNLPPNGLIQIRGKSGNGKSNFHTVLSYLWGYSQFPDTELQSFLTKDKIQAELKYEYNGQEGILRRGKEEFSFNDVKGSSKLVQSEIQKFLGIPIDLLEPLTVKWQRCGSAFLGMTDTKKKEFLSKLLNLEKLESSVKEGIKKINLFERELTEKQASIKTFKEILKEPVKPESKLELFSKVDETKQKIQELSLEASELYQQQKNLEIKIKTFREKFTTQQDLEILRVSQPSPEFSEEMNRLQDEYKELESNYKRYIINVKDQKQLSTKYKALLEKRCPTCSRYWDDTEEELERVTGEIQTSAHYECAIDKILNRQSEIQKFIDTGLGVQKLLREKEIKEIRSKYDKLLEDGEQDQVKLQKVNLTLGEKFTESTRLQVILDKQLKEQYRQEEIQKNYKWQLGIYESNLNRLLDMEHEYIQRNNSSNEEKDFAILLKGYLGFIFEELLDEIAVETNELLSKIQNVATVSVRFDMEKVNQDDTVRQEIKLIITQNGNQLPSFRTLSGGQQEAVELAIDLSLGNVISRRTGIFPGWLVLDEPFSGLGMEEKESCLEMLKIAARDRLIFVVDHSTESREFFDSFIEIDNQNGESSLKWQLL